MIVKKIQDWEIKKIHEKSLEILEEVGVNFEHEEILEFFRKKGVRTEGCRVFFTPSQVEEHLKSLRESFVIETPFASLQIGGGSRAVATASGAKQLDWQDGAETAVSMMTTLDCKTDLMFHAFGELDCLNVFSLEKYLLDEELFEARLSVEEKEYITEENIQMDMIKRVGPRGTYMLEDETLELYRTEVFHPRLFNCENYHNWKQQGMTSVVNKAHGSVAERLETYEAPVYDARRTQMLEDVLSVLG